MTVGRMLDVIVINQLGIIYQYGADKNASSLDVTGIMTIGEFNLSIDYHHTGNKSWLFSATVKPSPQNNANTTTVGQIYKDLTGDDDPLPDFVSDIAIGFKPDSDEITLCMASSQGVKKLATPDATPRLFATAFLKIGGLLTQFIQLRTLDTAKQRSITKRIFYTALQSAPFRQNPYPRRYHSAFRRGSLPLCRLR